MNMNIYNVNVWLDPEDPGSLIKSIEWHFVDWPVIKINDIILIDHCY